jgi:hypothetical protein
MKRLTYLISFTVPSTLSHRHVDRVMRGLLDDMRNERFYTGVRMIQPEPPPMVVLHREEQLADTGADATAAPVVRIRRKGAREHG